MKIFAIARTVAAPLAARRRETWAPKIRTNRGGVIVVIAPLLHLALWTAPPHVYKRVALVIGNGAYQNVTKLPNPMKDARAIAAMFKSAGFNSVTLRQDLGAMEFRRAVREFADTAQDA